MFVFLTARFSFSVLPWGGPHMWIFMDRSAGVLAAVVTLRQSDLNCRHCAHMYKNPHVEMLRSSAQHVGAGHRCTLLVLFVPVSSATGLTHQLNGAAATVPFLF